MDDAGALAAKLQSEGDRLRAFMSGLADHERAAKVYMEGTTWTVHDVLAHLMTAERAFLTLFEQIRLGGDGAAADFTIDRFNADQQRRTKDMSWTDLLQEYASARSQMVTFVASLARVDLEKRGRHPFLGVTTLLAMLKMMYIHSQTHLRDIRRSLRAEQGGE